MTLLTFLACKRRISQKRIIIGENVSEFTIEKERMCKSWTSCIHSGSYDVLCTKLYDTVLVGPGGGVLWGKKSHLKGIVSLPYGLREKCPICPALALNAVCDPHKTVKRNKAPILCAHCLYTHHMSCCTECHHCMVGKSTSSVGEALCIMCWMHHPSASAPTSNHHNLSVWRSDLSCRQGGTLNPTKTCTVNDFFM